MFFNGKIDRPNEKILFDFPDILVSIFGFWPVLTVVLVFANKTALDSALKRTLKRVCSAHWITICIN